MIEARLFVLPLTDPVTPALPTSPVVFFFLNLPVYQRPFGFAEDRIYVNIRKKNDNLVFPL